VAYTSQGQLQIARKKYCNESATALYFRDEILSVDYSHDRLRLVASNHAISRDRPRRIAW